MPKPMHRKQCTENNRMMINLPKKGGTRAENNLPKAIA
jgi:hypothetical protein